MSQSNPRMSAPAHFAPSPTRLGGPSSNTALGLEPTALERDLTHETSRLGPAREARRSRVAVRFLLASLPIFGVPACMTNPHAPDTTVGLDNGTVGMADTPSDVRLNDAA